jgi:hypothetical protein
MDLENTGSKPQITGWADSSDSFCKQPSSENNSGLIQGSKLLTLGEDVIHPVPEDDQTAHSLSPRQI